MNFKEFFFETTLQLHKDLNPKFWQDGKLDAQVKDKLISLANYWAEYAKIPQKYIKDLVFTGGNANYNYSPQSDVDLHLLVDKSKIDCEDLIDDYILDKKNLWSSNHDVRIKGYPVEIFAQDYQQETPADQGVYSLTKDKWLVKPQKEKMDISSKAFKHKLNHFIELINYFINKNVKDLDAIQKLKDKLRLFRTAGLKGKGEYSFENLIFKELRNLGYIEKLDNYFNSVIDQKFSL